MAFRDVLFAIAPRASTEVGKLREERFKMEEEERAREKRRNIFKALASRFATEQAEGELPPPIAEALQAQVMGPQREEAFGPGRESPLGPPRGILPPEIAQGIQQGQPPRHPRAPATPQELISMLAGEEQPESIELATKLAEAESKPGRGLTETFGKDIEYGLDAEGNIVPLQVGSAGTLKRPDLPAGVVGISPGGIIKIDEGANWGFYDREGRLVKTVPKSLAPGETPETKGKQELEKEKAKILAELQSPQNKSKLRVALQRGNEAIELVDDLLAHPGFSSSVGAKGFAQFGGLKKEPLAGTDAAGWMESFKQLSGQRFLEAYQGLRGAGAITSIEGDKAEQSLSAMSTAQNEKEFTKSARKFQRHVQNMIEENETLLREAEGGKGGEARKTRRVFRGGQWQEE